jgi:hypothetical protein
VLVWYRVLETEENGKVSVVQCAGLLQCGVDGGKLLLFRGVCAGLVHLGGDGGKWNVFSGDVCCS